MGRVSREQAEINRVRIVESACKLFRENGVENVSIADVMKTAGLTPGGFYKHFESKEALMEESFALAFKQSTDSWSRTLTSKATKGSQGPRMLAHKYFSQRVTQQVCPLLSFASQVSQQPMNSKAISLYEQGAQSLFNEFRAGLNKATPADAQQRPEAEAMLLFAAMVGTGMLSGAVGSSKWIEAIQEAVLEALHVSR